MKPLKLTKREKREILAAQMSIWKVLGCETWWYNCIVCEIWWHNWISTEWIWAVSLKEHSKKYGLGGGHLAYNLIQLMTSTLQCIIDLPFF